LADWRQLILPASNLATVRELVQRAQVQERERTVMALFTGVRGTGKTLASRIVAGALGVPLIEVDTLAASSHGPAPLAASVWQVLREASEQHAVLAFNDAAASLASGQANEEERFDLTARCDGYPGVVIFHSRSTVHLAQADVARLAAVIPFPFPDPSARALIWRRHLPQMARVDEADIGFLAEAFRLDGGAIAACAEAAISRSAHRGADVTRADLANALEAHYARWVLTRETRQALAALHASGASDQPEPETDHAQPAVDGASTRRTWPWQRRAHR
jgi:SpoVK/Ycf46/Vps4 family AAA+-type ATPase